MAVKGAVQSQAVWYHKGNFLLVLRIQGWKLVQDWIGKKVLAVALVFF